MMSTATERCPSSSIHTVRTWYCGWKRQQQNEQNPPHCFLLFPSVDNGYYFPYTRRYRRDSAVSVIKGNGAGGETRRRKDPVLLLPWWKEILGTIVFCIAATTYIVRKFFHPPAPVAYVRVRPQTQPADIAHNSYPKSTYKCSRTTPGDPWIFLYLRNFAQLESNL